METRKLKMICTKSKLGHSLSQISELTGLIIELVKQRLGQATGLPPEVLSNIFDMKQRGLSLELISQMSDVELEVLEQFLPQVIKKTLNSHNPPRRRPRPSSTAANTTATSCAGLISSLENSPAIKCLVTSSVMGVVGVSCLEEVYSSLVDILQEGR
jgi:hypothetical protein